MVRMLEKGIMRYFSFDRFVLLSVDKRCCGEVYCVFIDWYVWRLASFCRGVFMRILREEDVCLV